MSKMSTRALVRALRWATRLCPHIIKIPFAAKTMIKFT